uniref:Tetratricopeptide repeat protein 38 n=1 Tax=Brassica campestris TaxID=3711 RepID=M4D7G4_BRACM
MTYEVNTSSDDCIASIKSNSHQVLGYGRDMKVILEAPLYDKDCVLGNNLAAHYLFSSDISRAKTYARAAEYHLGKAIPYEKAFFEILPENQEHDYVYGMLAFSLLERGHLAEAEKRLGKDMRSTKTTLGLIIVSSRVHGSMLSFMGFMLFLEVYMDALGLMFRLHTRDKLPEFLDRLKVLADCLTDQKMWYQKWLFDITTIWALSKVGNTSQAHVLLEGLKSRTCNLNNKKQQLLQKAIQLAEAVYEYGKGNNTKALEMIGPNFDVVDYKVMHVLAFEKSYLMEGNAEAVVTTCEKANVLNLHIYFKFA